MVVQIRGGLNWLKSNQSSGGSIIIDGKGEAAMLPDDDYIILETTQPEKLAISVAAHPDAASTVPALSLGRLGMGKM